MANGKRPAGAETLDEIRAFLEGIQPAPSRIKGAPPPPSLTGMGKDLGLGLLNLIQSGREGTPITAKDVLSVPTIGGLAGIAAGPRGMALAAGATKGPKPVFSPAAQEIGKVLKDFKKKEEFGDVDIFEIGKRVEDKERVKRAEELGFNLDAFHGTNRTNPNVPFTIPPLPPFRRFDPEKTKSSAESEAGGAAFLSSSEKVAQAYGSQVFPLKVNTKNASVVDFQKEFGKPIGFDPEITGTVIEAARKAGKDVVIIRGMRDVGDAAGTTDQIVVINPAAVRSSLAKFDPKEVSSDDLLSVNGPTGVFVSAAPGELASAEFEQNRPEPDQGDQAVANGNILERLFPGLGAATPSGPGGTFGITEPVADIRIGPEEINALLFGTGIPGGQRFGGQRFGGRATAEAEERELQAALPGATLPMAEEQEAELQAALPGATLPPVDPVNQLAQGLGVPQIFGDQAGGTEGSLIPEALRITPENTISNLIPEALRITPENSIFGPRRTAAAAVDPTAAAPTAGGPGAEGGDPFGEEDNLGQIRKVATAAGNPQGRRDLALKAAAQGVRPPPKPKADKGLLSGIKAPAGPAAPNLGGLPGVPLGRGGGGQAAGSGAQAAIERLLGRGRASDSRTLGQLIAGR